MRNKRLTEDLIIDGKIAGCNFTEEAYTNTTGFEKVKNKLAEYERAEEQGELILLCHYPDSPCPYDYFTGLFYKETDTPTLPDWYFNICRGKKHICKREKEQVCKCWKEFNKAEG